MPVRTPYYVFDRVLFASLLRTYCTYGKVYFPVKANDSALVCSELDKCHCGYEVDSIEQIRALVQSGACPEDICYSYPVREGPDIREASNAGVRLFVVDSMAEYQKIRRLSSNVDFVIRLNVLNILNSSLPPEQNKWGLSLHEAASLISTIRRDKEKVAGISFYIADVIRQDDAFQIVLRAISSSFAGVMFEFVNIGGGISLEKLRTLAPLLERVKRTVVAKYIVIEPGRHLLNPCIDLITSVISVRYIDMNRLVYINAGVYSGLLDAVLKRKRYIVVDEQQNPTSALARAYICGSSSDVSDTLGEYELRTDMAVGDTLVIKECGAYSAVMQTHFCGKDHADMIVKDIGEDG